MPVTHLTKCKTTGAKKTSIQGHQVPPCRAEAPRGSCTQLGKSEQDGGKQDAQQAAGCASACRSWAPHHGRHLQLLRITLSYQYGQRYMYVKLTSH